jgi:carbon-monoxide dehydrogenase large subunit
MTTEMQERIVGRSIKRREDPTLITGRGSYLDDIKLAGMTHAVVVRSPYAHATITSIDTSAAKAHPGVVAVFTGEDMLDINPLPAAWQAGGVPNNVATPRALSVGKVAHVGDPVALVIAEDRYIARDAADLVEVDYEPLNAVVDARAAVQEGAPQITRPQPTMSCLSGRPATRARPTPPLRVPK